MRPALTSLDGTRITKRWTPEPAIRPGVPADARAPDSEEAASRAAPLSSAWRYSAQLNEQLTSAQQSLDFVDQLLRRLELFKSDLSRELGSRRVDGEALRARADDIGQQWQQRQDKTDGTLDGQLRFHVTGQARQRFALRGMDLSSLTQGSAETLVFIGPERGAQPAVVSVGEVQDGKQLLQRLNRSLAGLGIRAEVDEGGQLAFSVAEADLARLQEGLMVRGGGIRFPSGTPQRLRLEVEPDAMQGEAWQVDDHAGVRQSLQRVVRSIAQVQQARAAILSAIAEAEHSVAQLSRMDEQSWAQGFVNDFNARLNQSDAYLGYIEILPALAGISRYRVLSLLALR